jgi:hypothetical protein
MNMDAIAEDIESRGPFLVDDDSDPPTPYWAGEQFAHLISPKRYCRACRGISIESLSAPQGYLHSSLYKNPKTLGCDMCTIIAHYIEKSGFGDDLSFSLRLVLYLRASDSSTVQLHGLLATADEEFSFPIRIATRPGK